MDGRARWWTVAKTSSTPGQSLRTLLRAALEAARAADVPYAIGGALAMHAHGFERSTKDVDIFVAQENAFALLRALRVLGLKVIPISEPNNYAAYLPNTTDPEERIDVIVPEGEPGLSAIEWSETKELFGSAAQVFPLDLLVFAKGCALRPKDEFDLASLMARGMFDPRQVSELIRSIDPEGADEFDRAIQRLTRPSPPRRPPLLSRLPPRKR